MMRVNAEQTLAAGAELMAHFGADIDPLADAQGFRDAMQQLNPRFNGARDLVRYELEGDVTEWPDADKTMIMKAVTAQGLLIPETPLEGAFGHVVSLGAARQANLDRPRYAMAARRSGAARFAGLTIAGSARTIREVEQQNVQNYAPEALAGEGIDEFSLIVAAARTVARENPGTTLGIHFVDAEKADTVDVLRSVLAELVGSNSVRPGERIAAVTTQIYQPATELDTARVAEEFDLYGLAAGNPSDPNIVARRTPATYLSEVLRTTRAAHDYMTRLV